MDVITQEALTNLRSVLDGMLPPPAQVQLAPTVSLEDVRVAPTGLGGYIGIHDDPVGAVLGRRIRASALVTVRGNDANPLHTALAAVTDALLTADRVTLLAQGIQRLAMGELGPVSVEGAGANEVRSREARFELTFEHRRLPQEAGGVIYEIPMSLDLDEGGGKARTLIDLPFDTVEAMDQFEIVDDPLATLSTPSDWQYSEAEQRIEQRASIRGGGGVPTPMKAGTYLLLIPDGSRPEVRNFLLRARVRSDDPDGIGFVFRYLDVDNFYYFVMSERHGYSLLGKKVDGSFAALATPGLNDTAGYERMVEYQLKLAAVDGRFRVYLDDELAVQGDDPDIDEPGRVGFMAHANNRAFFYSLRLTGFLGD